MKRHELYSNISKFLREDEYYSLLSDFISYHRIQGTPEMKEAMCFLKEVLDASGVYTRVKESMLKFKKRTYGFTYFRGWEPEYMKATVIYGKKRIDLDFDLNPLAFVQRSGSLEGRFGLVPEGSSSVRERFVLVSNLKRGIYKYIMEKKAKGIAFYEPMAPAGARKKQQFWYHGPHDPELFGIVLTGDEITDILRFLKLKKRAYVEVFSSVKYRDATNLYLLARIEGETKDSILYVAHTCHARGEANDNGSGATSLLYAALVMRKMIDKGILKKPPYTVYFLFVPEMWGSALFVEKEREVINNTFAGFNFDMVGSDLLKTNGKVVIEKTHASICTNLPEIFKSHVESVQDFLDFPFAVYMRNFEGGSDHLIFQDFNFRLPMPMLIHWPDRFYHTDMDVISNINPRAIWRNVILMVSMPYLIKKNRVLFRKSRTVRGSSEVYEVLKPGVYIPTFDEDFEERVRWMKLLDGKKGYVNFMHFFYYIDGNRGFSDILSLIRRDSKKEPDKEIYREYVNYLLNREIIRKKT